MATDREDDKVPPSARAEIFSLKAEAVKRARDFISLHAPLIDTADKEAVLEVLRGESAAAFAQAGKLEDSFVKIVDVPHAVACASGSAALHLALHALGVGKGQLVILPALASVAVANATQFAGAEIAFADVDPVTGLMGPGQVKAVLDRLKRKISPPVGAVISVHLNGQCANVAELHELTQSRGTVHIEEATQALGARYRGGKNFIPVGSCRHSEAACFSFRAPASLASGEGAVLTMRTEEHADRARSLAGLGFSPRAHTAFTSQDEQSSDMHLLGFDYRIGGLYAALAANQLGKLDGFIAKRRALAAIYAMRLKNLEPLLCPVPDVPAVQHARSLYPVLIDFARAGVSRSQLVQELRADGVATAVHYLPLTDQPYYLNRYGPQELPGARAYAARSLSLPLHPAMTEKHVERVVKSLARHLTV
jgi:dTDP-4-amino-4,6-dideoxygalactose transaminase